MNDFAEEEEKYFALARQQADIFENIKRGNGPGREVRREDFWALVVDARVSTLDQVLAALVDFARPALDFSQLPEELFAWTARVGDYHVVFHGSVPSRGSWIEGEHMMERFGSLPAYFHLEHDKNDPRFDRLVEFDGDGLRIMSVDHSDYDRAFFDQGRKVDQNDPWRLLRERTGIGLVELRNAIESGEPRYLVCRRAIVLAGVPRNKIAVRRASEEKPKPKEPSFDEVFAEAEKEWVEVFEGRVYAHARKVAKKANATRLRELLERKGPKPRSSRIALAALGMMGPETASAAPTMVTWTQKTSEPLRHAAIGALASLGESARDALTAGSASRKSLEKKACTGLLRLLDHPSFQPLRDLRAMKVSKQVTARLASDDLVAINAQDLDWKVRDQERDTLVRDGGAAMGAWYLRFMLEQPTDRGGMRLDAGTVLRLIEDDPLAPWVVPLLLVERPLGESMLDGYLARKKLVATAKQLLGKPFESALAAIARISAK
ncbi:MAG: hypothetical protein ACXVEE_28115 [Polyangiales bacterium]